MSRFAKHFRIFFVEEAVFDATEPFLDNHLSEEGVWVIVPHLRPSMDNSENEFLQEKLLREVFSYFQIDDFLFWYYNPMPVSWSKKFNPAMIIYDCMDELSAFKNPPVNLKQRETDLFDAADLVFTGGQSLFAAKKHRHSNIHVFPSSIDKKHFGKAKLDMPDPFDQAKIAHPRIGFFGVIDERLDQYLLKSIALKRPRWQFIFLGPIVKIDPSELPQFPNIHYLGAKSYEDLPKYLAGWDVAIMPFAINESTRFISPTKTPEYLAGGKPVVSTAIFDVVHPYGDKNLVYIAKDAADFAFGIEQALMMREKEGWKLAVEEFLVGNSWDITVEKMLFLINKEQTKDKRTVVKQINYV